MTREYRNFHEITRRIVNDNGDGISTSCINLCIIKLERPSRPSRTRTRVKENAHGKGDRKRNREMNLFMDGDADRGFKCKIGNTYEIYGVQVKRGEYISSGINLFELGLHWNNWTLQRAMIFECSCERRDISTFLF